MYSLCACTFMLTAADNPAILLCPNTPLPVLHSHVLNTALHAQRTLQEEADVALDMAEKATAALEAERVQLALHNEHLLQQLAAMQVEQTSALPGDGEGDTDAHATEVGHLPLL